MATAKVRPLTAECIRGHALNFDEVLKTFKLKQSDVLDVFIRGSHLWQTCQSQSDWDLVIVLLDSSQTLKQDNVQIKSGRFDTVLLKDSSFKCKLQQHNLKYLLPLWDVQMSVKRRNPDELLKSFELSKEVLLCQLKESIDRDIKTAKKHFDKRKTKQSKKILVHCLQYAAAVNQILIHGRLVDYGECNVYRNDVLLLAAFDWAVIDSFLRSAISSIHPVGDSIE